IGTHGRNLAALDEHVGLFEVADGAVESEYAAALDQDRPPRCGRAAGLLSTGRADHARSGNGGGPRGAQELAARQRRLRIARGAGTERAAGETAQMRHGVLPCVCCCERDAIALQAPLLARRWRTSKQAWVAAHAGEASRIRRAVAVPPYRDRSKSKGAHDIVTRSHELAFSRRAVAAARPTS